MIHTCTKEWLLNSAYTYKFLCSLCSFPALTQILYALGNDVELYFGQVLSWADCSSGQRSVALLRTVLFQKGVGFDYLLHIVSRRIRQHVLSSAPRKPNCWSWAPDGKSFKSMAAPMGCSSVVNFSYFLYQHLHCRLEDHAVFFFPRGGELHVEIRNL